MFSKSLKMEKWDKRYMKLAFEVASWSEDPMYKHGCVAIKNNNIVGTGVNGMPSGEAHYLMHDRDRKRAAVIHSEQNCIYNCKDKDDLVGSTFYIGGIGVGEDTLLGGLTPCGTCASAMIQVGVTRIVLGYASLKAIDKYKDNPPYFLESTIERLERRMVVEYYDMETGRFEWRQ